MGFINRIDSVLKEYRDRNCLADREGQRKLTYRNLDELSGKAAVKLRALGIRKGDTVMIRIGRSSEYIAAEYGAVRMGAVAIPVLPSYPEARSEYIRKDAGVKLILTEAFFDDIDRYDFDADRAKPDCFDVDRGEEAAEERRFIFYTSGSTGVPKGVVYHDRAVLNAVERNLTETILKIKPFIYAASGSMSFTVSITEYYRSFAVGGFVHILSEETRTDILKVQDYYAAHEISMGFLSPRMLRVYRNRDPFLKIIGTGSERVVNTWSDEYVITNGYGQTETVGGFCVFRIDKPYENTPVGKPLPGVSIRIADENDRDVPDGEEGYIIATGYFPREYHNLPEQTAKTFRNLGNGLVEVHTGDMGKILPDGNLLFVNRKDWMLKVHGQRVEPGEIEVCMNETEGVSASVVKGFEQDDGSMLLCGFYTGDASKDAIRAHLAEKLPHYMVPAVLVRLDRFPVNPNGKVDRMALEKPDLSLFRAEYEAPANALEEKICGAMEKVLGIPGIGRNDDFFLLGGNSINSVLLVEACGVRGLSAKHIVLGKTPKGIADSFTNTTSAIRPEIVRTEKNRTEFTMTNAQKYQLNECEKIGCEMDLNDFRGFWRIEEGIDIEKLRQAVETAFAESPGMNVCFDRTGKKMYKTSRKPKMPVLTIKEEDFEAYRRGKTEVVRDLMKDELYELAIIHCGGTDYLYININHLLYDESSLKNLIDEIRARYGSAEPATEAVDIFDLSVYEQAIRESDYYREAVQYHEDLYAKISADNLPEKQEKQDRGFYRIVAPGLDRKRVENFLKENGVSEIIYLQTAFALALSETLIRSDRLTYMTVYDGRTDPKTRSIKGVLAQSLYMAVELKKGQKIRDLLNTVQATYQNLSYYGCVDVVEMAERYPNIRNDIYLNFRGSVGLDFQLGGRLCKYENIGMFYDNAHVRTRLNFVVDHTPDRHYFVQNATGYYDKNMLVRLTDAFENMLVKLLDAKCVNELTD